MFLITEFSMANATRSSEREEIEKLQKLLRSERDVATRLKAELREREERILELEGQVEALVNSGSDIDFRAYCAKVDLARDRFLRSQSVYDQRDRMIRAQAEHISKLRSYTEEARKAEDRLRSEVAGLRKQAFYYSQIQKACLESDSVMSEWQRFCAVLQMAESDDTPAITDLVKS